MNHKPAQFYVLLTAIKWEAGDSKDLPKQVFAPIENPLIPHRFLEQSIKDWVENEYGTAVNGFKVNTI